MTTSLRSVVNRTSLDSADDSEEQASTAEGEEEVPMVKVTEAKIELILKYFAQLLAQMLDQLKSRKISLKRSAEGQSKGPAGVVEVRGILTTGQRALFFGLRDPSPTASITSSSASSSSSSTAGQDVLPQLTYYGSYSLDVLPRKTGRESGLADPVEEGVSAHQIRELLLAYIVFFNRSF